MRIKSFYCQVCEERGKEFLGNREAVRKHLREEHLLRGKRKGMDGKKIPSILTKNTKEVTK